MILLQEFDSKKITIKTISFFLVFIFLTTGFYLLIQSLFYTDSVHNLQASVNNPIEITGMPQQSGQSDQPKQLESSQTLLLNTTLAQVKNHDLQINAKSAVSIEFGDDAEGKILFKKNVDEKLPIASLVKLMTVFVVLERYDLDQEVMVSKSAMEQVGEQGVLKEGEVLSVKNLLYIALIESSNRAAFALSEVIGVDNFVDLMNEGSQILGLLDTHFEDNTGLDENSYSTVVDLARLSNYLFSNYPLFREIVNLKEFNLYLPDGSLHHKLVNTNELLEQHGVVGGKTGYTLVAKGCFMAIQKITEEKHIVHIVLGADDRLLEMQKLIAISDTNY